MELAAMIQQAQDAAPTGDAYLDSAKGRLAYRVTAPDNFDPNRFVNCTANDIVVMRYGLGAYNVLPGCGYDYLEIEWYNGHFQPYRVYGLFSVNLSLNLVVLNADIAFTLHRFEDFEPQKLWYVRDNQLVSLADELDELSARYLTAEGDLTDQAYQNLVAAAWYNNVVAERILSAIKVLAEAEA